MKLIMKNNKLILAKSPIIVGNKYLIARGGLLVISVGVFWMSLVMWWPSNTFLFFLFIGIGISILTFMVLFISTRLIIYNDMISVPVFYYDLLRNNNGVPKIHFYDITKVAVYKIILSNDTGIRQKLWYGESLIIFIIKGEYKVIIQILEIGDTFFETLIDHLKRNGVNVEIIDNKLDINKAEKMVIKVSKNFTDNKSLIEEFGTKRS